MDKQKRIDRIWKYLNEEGIYTIEELNRRIQEMPKINIAPFIKPIEGDELDAGCHMRYSC